MARSGLSVAAPAKEEEEDIDLRCPITFEPYTHEEGKQAVMHGCGHICSKSASQSLPRNQCHSCRAQITSRTPVPGVTAAGARVAEAKARLAALAKQNAELTAERDRLDRLYKHSSDNKKDDKAQIADPALRHHTQTINNLDAMIASKQRELVVSKFARKVLQSRMKRMILGSEKALEGKEKQEQDQKIPRLLSEVKYQVRPSAPPLAPQASQGKIAPGFAPNQARVIREGLKEAKRIFKNTQETIIGKMDLTTQTIRKNPLQSDSQICDLENLTTDLRKTKTEYVEKRKQAAKASDQFAKATLTPFLRDRLRVLKLKKHINDLKENIIQLHKDQESVAEKIQQRTKTASQHVTTLFAQPKKMEEKKKKIAPPAKQLDPDTQRQFNIAFCKAVREGNIAEAHQLLANGAEIESANQQQKTDEPPAFFDAIIKQHNAMVDFLLANQIKIDQINCQAFNYYGGSIISTGATALMIAAAHNTQVATSLINAKASISERQPVWRWTPLHFSAFGANESSARLLLSHKASIDEKTEDGNTAHSVLMHFHKQQTGRRDATARVLAPR